MSVYPSLDEDGLFYLGMATMDGMTDEEKAVQKVKNREARLRGQKWNADHPVSADHVYNAWHAASEGHRQAGMTWYQDGKHFCHVVSKDTGVHPHAVAGLLALYSPKTHWADNMHTVLRVCKNKKGEGGPGSGIMATDDQRQKADNMLNGQHPSEIVKGQKTGAFLHLLHHGGNQDDDDPQMCCDRHALSGAAGKRVPDEAFGVSGLSGKKRYAEVADCYHDAAHRISKESGTKVHAHQVQAAVWLHQQDQNEKEDIANNKRGASASATAARRAWAHFHMYAAEHHPALLGRIPGTGYGAKDLPEEIVHAKALDAEGHFDSQKVASLLSPYYPSLEKLAHDSGDGQTLYHCPFCGSGQLIARSDKTNECEFCHTAFTVQVQPQYPAFPQTIDGMPVDVPGMPGQVDQSAEVPPTDEDGAPIDPEDAEDPSEEAGAEDGAGGPVDGSGGFSGKPGPSNQPPWLASRTFRNLEGVEITGASYVRHLALAHAADPDAVLAAIRLQNSELS